MSRPNLACGVKRVRPSYWERPCQRQTSNSQKQIGSCRPTHFSECHTKRPKIVPACWLSASLPTLPTEIWLSILQAMSPKDLQGVMQVNRLWYSEANKILLVAVTNLLKGKGLQVFRRIGTHSECPSFLANYVLPPTFEAYKRVHFYSANKGCTAFGSVTVISLLEKEGLDGHPEGVWREGPGFLRACLTKFWAWMPTLLWFLVQTLPGL